MSCAAGVGAGAAACCAGLDGQVVDHRPDARHCAAVVSGQGTRCLVGYGSAQVATPLTTLTWMFWPVSALSPLILA